MGADNGSSSMPIDPAYEAKKAKEKQSILWQKIVASRYTKMPEFSGLEALPVLANSLNANTKSYYQVTMQRESDEMPAGRAKRIHTYGSVAKIKFVADPSSRYSGLFKGVKYGLIRTSLAAKSSETNTIPGLAVKFLIDGLPSGNFMAMYSLDGQDSYDYFRNTFSNEVKPPTGAAVKILTGVFSRVSSHPNRVGVRHLAGVLENGAKEPSFTGPNVLELIPNKSVLYPIIGEKGFVHDVRDDFQKIPAGTVLYEVVAVLDPDADPVYSKKVGRTDKVGKIVTDSEFVASDYGDSQLFFRHENYNTDGVD